MKTIEERFEEFAALACINSDTPEYHIAKAFWLQSATEQRAIDDEQLPIIKETYYNAGYETAENKMVDKACEWLKARNVLTDASLEGFRKAMEEEI